MVFAEDQPVVLFERAVLSGHMQQPLEMRTAPVGAFAKDEAAAGQELEDVVTRLENLFLERLAAAHDITHTLIALARNPHYRELTRPIEASEIGGISLVVLSLDARSLRD